MTVEGLSVSEALVETGERELIRRSISGEREAFGALVREYMGRAYRVTYALVGNHADAVELSQEAFARAYRSLHRFDPESPFYPWFRRILRNLAYDRLRRRRLEPQAADVGALGLADSVVRKTPGPAEAAEKHEAAEALQAALATLEPEEREVTWMKLVDGMSYRAISEEVGVSATTVAARVAAARKKLRHQLRSFL
jgi:RNA polymerase sigma-70 factor (ECF subfamily)